MKLAQTAWSAGVGWSPRQPPDLPDSELVLLFGGGAALSDPTCLQWVREAYPDAYLLGCSTAGEICGARVTDDGLIATAIELEDSRAEVHTVAIRGTGSEASAEAGRHLAGAIEAAGLRHVFVLSDGLRVNGSDLVRGLTAELPDGVTITGGLSGDGARFQETLVLCNAAPRVGEVAAMALYGDALSIGYASLGGWDPFGPERVVTRSHGNVLYELDGQSALSLYKRYLGEHAAGLPATGLLFPLALRTEETDAPVVRTILSVDERDQSMTFAGDLPEGSYARLMKANFDRLVDGAAEAARISTSATGALQSPDLAILISCVGRKMVLKQRVEEEVEAVRDILGESTVMTGFYSYGEISPFTPNARCELHNQTMTITTLSER